MKTPFKLKYNNSAFPFKESPMKQGIYDILSRKEHETTTYIPPKEEPIVVPDPKIEEKKKQLDLEKEMKELYRKYEGLRRLSLSAITTGASSLWKSFWGD